MEAKILDKKENPMLNRIAVSGELNFKGATPSNADLQKAIADKMSVSPMVVKVRQIKTAFGESTATFEAHVYKTKEDLDRLEPLGKKAKEKIAKAAEAAKEKKPAGAPKEAKPAEKKEEAKPEEKKEEAKPAEKKEEVPKEEPKKEAPKEKPKE